VKSDRESTRRRARWSVFQKMVSLIDFAIPQGLKPSLFCGTYGTTKVEPFQSSEFFRSL
jgi:hypothetical protein